MALEGAYAFDDVGSTTVLDLSGNGRNIDLTGSNGVQVDSGGLLDGGALGKTGVSIVSLPSSVRTASETDDRTLMFDALGTRAVWWVRWESTSLDTGVWGILSLDESAMLARARTQVNGASSPGAPTIGTLSDIVRHNFAMTYIRATGVLTYYYDGVQIGTATFAAGTALYTGADDLNIAEWTETGPAIDNLRIFSHALTSIDVGDVAGTPVTASGTEVFGIAATNLGGLSGMAIGVRNTAGVMTAAVGGLTATATGLRTVNGTVASDVGGLTATASGSRTTSGNMVTGLGALTATASGIGTVSGSAVASLAALTATTTGSTTGPSTALAQLGSLISTANGTKTVNGTALSVLDRLIATAVVPNPLPTTRLRVSGREPYRYANGREPRESV